MDRPPATFSGFSEPVPELYEFWTKEGNYVYLHEMDCVSIHFNPMSRRLDLAFECVASTLMHHPITLVLSFEETQVMQWFDDASDQSTLTSSGAPARIRGQVTDLSHNENGTFSLQLLDVNLAFDAVSVTCHVRPGLWNEIPSHRPDSGIQGA